MIAAAPSAMLRARGPAAAALGDAAHMEMASVCSASTLAAATAALAVTTIASAAAADAAASATLVNAIARASAAAAFASSAWYTASAASDRPRRPVASRAAFAVSTAAARVLI